MTLQNYQLTSEQYQVEDVDAFADLAYEKGWTDGMPVFPPTLKKVTEIIDYVQRSPDEVLGIVSPGEGVATIEKVAINCAMAGCKPDYLPATIESVRSTLIGTGIIAEAELDAALASCRRHLADPGTVSTSFMTAQVWGWKR